jgi:hypothetical protein
MACNPKPYRKYEKLSRWAWSNDHRFDVSDVSCHVRHDALESWWHLTIRPKGKPGPIKVLSTWGLE